MKSRDWYGVLIPLAVIVGSLLLMMLCGCSGARAVASGAPIPKPPPGGADLNYVLLCTVALSILGIGASVLALVWLPTKRMALAGVAGFGSMLAIALTVKVLQPYLLWVALAGLAAAAVGAILAMRKLGTANTLAVMFGRDMSRAITDEDAEQVKATHAALQDAAGVRAIIDRILAKTKAT